MKPIFSLLIALLLGASLQAQSPAPHLFRNRIYFSEKINQPLDVMPSLLLEAFAKGDLRAYDPQDLNKDLGYYAFLDKFQMPYPAWLGDEDAEPPCLDCPQSNVPALMMDRFKVCADYLEESVDNGLDNERRIRYVCLMYYDPIWGAHTARPGPVFKMDDIVRLGMQLPVVNEKNRAAPWSLKHLLLTRRFSAVVVNENDFSFEETKEVLKPYRLMGEGGEE